MGTKTNEKTVRVICRLLEDGKLPKPQIAEKANVSLSTVVRIARKDYHQDISQEYKWNTPYTPTNHYHDKLDEKVVRAICDMLQDSIMSGAEIASRIDVSEALVSKIYTGVLYQNISKDYDFSNRPIFNRTHVYTKGIITSLDMNAGIIWDQVIVDEVPIPYETNIFGELRKIKSKKMVKTGSLIEDKNENTVIKNYRIQINGRKLCISRARLIASLYVAIPKKYKNIDVRRLVVKKRPNSKNPLYHPNSFFWHLPYVGGGAKMNTDEIIEGVEESIHAYQTDVLILAQHHFPRTINGEQETGERSTLRELTKDMDPVHIEKL